MIKTANAGNTAKGGILGRRKRAVPEPTTYVTMWLKGEDDRPELVRCPLAEARKSGAEATLAERRNEPIKSRRNPGVFEAQKSPDPRSKRAPHCRYCGAVSAYPWGAQQICLRCEKIRDRHEPQATIQTIAAKMQADPTLSWNQARDSDGIGDDELLRKVQRTLAI